MGDSPCSSSLLLASQPGASFRRFMSDSYLSARQSESLKLPQSKQQLQHPEQHQLSAKSMLFFPAPTPLFQPSNARIAADLEAASKRRSNSRMISSSDDEIASVRTQDSTQFAEIIQASKENLSLIERLGGDTRPTRRTRQDQMHLQLSEILICTFEELSWKRKMNSLKAELAAEDQNPPVFANYEAGPENHPSTSFAEFRSRANLNSTLDSTSACQFGHQQAGNSTFYSQNEPSEAPEDEGEFEEPLLQFEQCNLNSDVRNTPSPSEQNVLLDSPAVAETPQEADEGGEASSAERVASDLLRYFTRQQAVMEAVDPEDVKWLVSFADAPQKLLPMPSTSGLVVSSDEIYTTDGKRILLRGTTSWAPPKKKFIFRDPPYVAQMEMIGTQNFRCAGCGMRLDKVYIKRTRYCNYYGKWFCQVCHQGAKHRIPAKIIRSWDFQAYPVSDYAFNFLSENVHQPVFDLDAIDPLVYRRIKQLRKAKQLRLMLAHLWSYVSMCRTARHTVTQSGNLNTMFTSLPSRYLVLNQVDIYTLADLEQVYNKNLFQSLEPVVEYGKLHVESCPECQPRGYFCELCQFSELLFPFYIDKVERCAECGALAHLKCYKKMRKENPQITCTKCERRRFHDQRRELSRSFSDANEGN
ncbi:hypothetical protein L596_016091 [Steinernema carpocapsae]|uniref:Rubicon Homology domain-containing protein n=1 Tax=Steinernema carpocapsae TaxID=34508 RepID=A0A4U5NHY9_STECR|nr:hypothetical protein L596_016091 [Steinernema carpocapsae]